MPGSYSTIGASGFALASSRPRSFGAAMGRASGGGARTRGSSCFFLLRRGNSTVNRPPNAHDYPAGDDCVKGEICPSSYINHPI